MDHNSTRRMLLTALAGMTLTNISLASAASGAANIQNNSRTLVAYFSRSGNTRVIAGVIQRSLKTDLFKSNRPPPTRKTIFRP